MNSTLLNIEHYNLKEAEATSHLSNDHVRAFSTVTFSFEGYPAYAKCEREILRYCDTMQELNAPLKFHEEMEYSLDEGVLAESICNQVVTIAKKQFHTTLRPWMGPLPQMKMLRAVQAIAAAYGKSSLRILEIGPGSGYLGAMLIALGHQYYATDACQGFYLWQSRFFQHVSGGDFLEGAQEDSWPYQSSARVTHIPWWDFATLFRKRLPEVDLVICDTALGEMNSYCVRYLTQLSFNMLTNSDVGVFLYSNIGSPRMNNDDAIFCHFDRVGFVPRVKNAVKVHTLPGRSFPDAVMTLDSSIPHFAPSGRPGTVRGRDFMQIIDEEMPPSYDFYVFLGFERPRKTGVLGLTRYQQGHPSNNPLSLSK